MTTSQNQGKSFDQYKLLCQREPVRLMSMIGRQGSQSLKKSRCIKQSVRTITSNITKTIPTILFTPVISIYLATILLHRKRSFALTSGTIFRNFTLKYLPGIAIFGTIKLRNCSSFDASIFQKDFEQIEGQFSRIYEKHGEKYFKPESLREK